jgi:hypothetical protein
MAHKWRALCDAGDVSMTKRKQEELIRDLWACYEAGKIETLTNRAKACEDTINRLERRNA